MYIINYEPLLQPLFAHTQLPHSRSLSPTHNTPLSTERRVFLIIIIEFNYAFISTTLPPALRLLQYQQLTSAAATRTTTTTTTIKWFCQQVCCQQLQSLFYKCPSLLAHWCLLIYVYTYIYVILVCVFVYMCECIMFISLFSS